MKNASSNIEIAPAVEFPDIVRIPLHSLQADLEYLIGRVIADGSCGPVIVKSMRDRLNQIEDCLVTLPEVSHRSAVTPDLDTKST